MKRGLGGDWPGKMEQMLGSFQVLGSLKFPKIDLTQVLKNRWLKFGAGGEGRTVLPVSSQSWVRWRQTTSTTNPGH